jgi:23S rRNA (cytidine1920-2'-O)/16S rRNA (cytidine1409-2'-O)-methyltransferase
VRVAAGRKGCGRHVPAYAGGADAMNRVDVELVARGLAPTRSAAQRLIADGAVSTADGTTVTRPSMQVPQDVALSVRPSVETRFVSRAGAKLDDALRRTGIDVHGRTVLDLGMSTGGFADCLLQAGAQAVLGIEVGHGQLHPSLRADPRVHCLEHTNVRELDVARLGDRLPAGGFTRAVADLSFISLTLALPPVDPLLAPGADLLLLVKPQFELDPGQAGRRGVVSDEALRRRALARLEEACAGLGWRVIDTFDSALPGGDGNREYFLHANKP